MWKRCCAVKIFRQELKEKEWIERRFRQEVSALTQICHPNVVGIYGHGTARDGAPYLAMEFIEGDTLREALNKSRLGRKCVAAYLRQTSSALSAIHAHHVCHRDLKPENLMIRENAEPAPEIVLIDFSIAIVKDPDETMHGLSRAAGTLHYMAPDRPSDTPTIERYLQPRQDPDRDANRRAAEHASPRCLHRPSRAGAGIPRTVAVGSFRELR